MGPINYQQEVATPFDSFSKTMASMMALRQAATETQKAEADAERQKQIHDVAQSIYGNPNAGYEQYSQLVALLPKDQSDAVQKAWSIKSEGQKQEALDRGSKVFSALSAGQPEIAKKLLSDQAAAYRNSGQEGEARYLESWAKVAEVDPNSAILHFGSTLAQLPGGDKVIEAAGKIGVEQRSQALAGSAQTKAEAEAHKAAIDAKFAESSAALDLQKKGWDITKIQSDISIARDNQRIANAKEIADKTTNGLQQDKLKSEIEKMEVDRDDKVRNKVADAESARQAIDSALNTIARIKQNKALPDVLGAVEGSDIYPTTIAAMASNAIAAPNPLLNPSSADDRKSAIADIDQLSSQSFTESVKQIGSMAGLTEKEGEKLQKSRVSLVRNRGESAFMGSLKDYEDILLKSRAAISNKYGIPDTIPDTKRVMPTPEEINDVANKYLQQMK